MIGFIIEFTESSPLKESKSILIRCENWDEFKEKLKAKFGEDIHYMEVDSLDAEYHEVDAYFRIGKTTYNCNHNPVDEIF